MRYRYFARSAPARLDQPFSKASRAAPTASCTSSSVAWPTSARGSSLDGSMVAYVSFASTHSPPMKWPYRSRMVTMSRDSGALAYSQPAGMGARSCFRCSSVTRQGSLAPLDGDGDRDHGICRERSREAGGFHMRRSLFIAVVAIAVGVAVAAVGSAAKTGPGCPSARTPSSSRTPCRASETSR